MTTAAVVSTSLSIMSDIPATVTLPAKDQSVPAVLLLHGTASHRDEVGNMYARLADALAERGIAALRIDFAGCGASRRAQTEFTVTSQLADARAAYTWLVEHPKVDPTRVAVLGFSQGGMIALLLAHAQPQVAALATWSSGMVQDAFGFLEPAFADGATQAFIDMGFASFRFSRTWWREINDLDLSTPASSLQAPLLAVAGASDTQVPPEASLDLIRAVASTDITFLKVPHADHIFNVLDADTDLSPPLLELTANWFASRLVREPSRQIPCTVTRRSSAQ